MPWQKHFLVLNVNCLLYNVLQSVAAMLLQRLSLCSRISVGPKTLQTFTRGVSQGKSKYLYVTYPLTFSSRTDYSIAVCQVVPNYTTFVLSIQYLCCVCMFSFKFSFLILEIS